MSCKNANKSILFIFSIINPLLSYGCESGGDGEVSSSLKNKISSKTFNLCIKEKSYLKDKKGIFELPEISCK